MRETKPVQAASTGTRRRPDGKRFGLLVLAGWMAEAGLAQAAAADGPAQVPSALHALAMLAVFFVLASIRVTWTGGRLRLRFELSPIPRSATAKHRA